MALTCLILAHWIMAARRSISACAQLNDLAKSPLASALTFRVQFTSPSLDWPRMTSANLTFTLRSKRYFSSCSRNSGVLTPTPNRMAAKTTSQKAKRKNASETSKANPPPAAASALSMLAQNLINMVVVSAVSATVLLGLLAARHF